ncbi:hypothetical protein [Sporobacter termitidis]|uniref:hypothetical protein n=1 Tax=Sporobacter termitidis TaxID=44749 RepID=UPI000934CA9E|nr:hypothetical protein [Sporobacter termitidis]
MKNFLKWNAHSSTLITAGTIASSLGLLALSFEIIVVQFFRFYMWNNGIVYWSPQVSVSGSRGTSASDIISTAWINVAFIITVIVALLGMILLFVGVMGRLSGKSSESR